MKPRIVFLAGVVASFLASAGLLAVENFFKNSFDRIRIVFNPIEDIPQ